MEVLPGDRTCIHQLGLREGMGPGDALLTISLNSLDAKPLNLGSQVTP